ncbi:uncharacterized protein LOC110857292 [Folsomia candida]|uniref:Replication factor A 51 kDa subunit n=1 Tax=Folsomia candida TaxID=158441 RepID=A0A226DK63_FOLCA|nr:uncharacterized protein LOC110857292 [Folsomia candida]OXA45244.1 Replication factor A 51 kDa subunit [Folsomia candida]
MEEELVPVRVSDILPPPEMWRVHVKAKVVCKTGVHNTAMGSASGPFYKILLADKTDQIYLFVYLHPRPPLGANRKFTEEMQEVVDLLEIGQVYTFAARVRNYHPDYTVQTQRNGAELLFDNMVDTYDDEEEDNVMEDAKMYLPLQFSSADVIRETDVGQAVDVLGTVVRVGATHGAPDDLLRFVTLEIMGGRFHCNVWRGHEKAFRVNAAPFRVAIQGAKVTTFDHRIQLHIGNTAIVYMMNTEKELSRIDPNIREGEFFSETFGSDDEDD